MKLVLLGPPGAGKGTLAGLLKKKFKIKHISTGDMLRVEMKKQTKLGKEIKRFIESGALVPDEVVTKLLENTMKAIARQKQGFMLDGYPRTQHQAEDLDRILTKFKIPIRCTLNLEASLPIIVQRLSGRRICRNCGTPYHIINRPPKIEGVCDVCRGELYQRTDDNAKTIKNRMKVYQANTRPILNYYRSQKKLHTLNADEDAEHVVARLIKILNEDKKSHSHKNA